MKWTLLLLCFSLEPALADSIHEAKSTRDCGGVSEDLRNELPPADSQMQSPWCATFTSKLLLEHLMNRTKGTTAPFTRISATDLNAWSAVKTAERGKPDFGSNDFSSVLEGVQEKGELYLDADLPFDQSFFDQDGTLERLTAYYQRQNPFTLFPEAFACRELGKDTRELESRFPELTTLVKATDSQKFLSALANEGRVLGAARNGAKRVPIPPFNARRLTLNTGDEVLAEIQRTLKLRRPLAVGVCANKLLRYRNFGKNMAPPDSDPCGPHAMVIAGMQVRQGECHVLLRNSWGTKWPTPEDKGYAWMPAKDFLKILGADVLKGARLASISPREPGTRVEDEIIVGNDKYRGEVKELRPHGQGTSEVADGTIMKGKFVNGLFTEGYYKGKLSTGTYEGEMKNNRPSGKGKLVLTNGAVAEGEFREGILSEGTFRGLIDPARGMFYEGPMKNGGTQPGGKFTDKNGRPWKF